MWTLCRKPPEPPDPSGQPSAWRSPREQLLAGTAPGRHPPLQVGACDQAGKKSMGLVVVTGATSLSSKRNIRTR